MNTYTERVDDYLLGIEHVSFNSDDEGSFSHSPCELCQSPLGGQQYGWRGIDTDTGETIEGSGCADCVLYITNGTVPGEVDA